MSATGFEDTFTEGLLECRAVVRQLELDDQHEEQDMDATYAAMTGGLVATTERSQHTQAAIGCTSDATLAGMFVEEDVEQPVARATGDKSLASAPVSLYHRFPTRR